MKRRFAAPQMLHHTQADRLGEAAGEFLVRKKLDLYTMSEAYGCDVGRRPLDVPAAQGDAFARGAVKPSCWKRKDQTQNLPNTGFTAEIPEIKSKCGRQNDPGNDVHDDPLT